MTLRETLETSFSGEGVDADAVLRQVADLYRGLDLPAAPFDPASIAAQVATLSQTDASGLAGLLDAPLAAASAAIAALPGPGPAIASLHAAVAALDALGSGTSGPLEALRDGLFAPDPDGDPVDRVTRRMAAASAGLDGIATAGAAVLPGIPVARLGPVQEVLAAADGLPAMLAAVRGLMGVVSGVQRLATVGTAAASLPDAAALDALRAAVAAWDPATTVARIASGDPVDDVVRDVEADLGRIGDLEQALAMLVAGSASLVATVRPADAHALVRTADEALGTLDVAPVRRLAEQLAAALAGPLRAIATSGTVTPDAFATELDSLLGGITDALAAVKVDQVTTGVEATVDRVTAPIHAATAALDAVRGAVTDAEDAMAEVLGAVDLQPVTDGITAITEPLAAALTEITSAFAAVSAAVSSSAATATGAIGELRTGADTAASTLGDAFGGVAAALDELDIPARLQQVGAALAPVTASIEQVRIAEAADAASHGIDTVAGVVGALPLDLLPQSARADLDAAVAPIKTFDFDTEVRDRIAAAIAQADDAVDTDVLDAVRAAQADAAAFIAGIDPRPAIVELEHETFAPVLDRLHAFDPDAALAPVHAAIARIPDLSHVLDPADEAFDRVLAAFDQLSPAQLLEPVVAPLAAAREAAGAQLRLDAVGERLTASRDAALAAIDHVSVARWLDGLAAVATAALDTSAPGSGAGVGGLVLGLTGGVEDLDAGAFAAVRELLSGRSPASSLTDAAGVTAATLGEVRSTLRVLDAGALLADVQPGYDAVAAAITALPAASPLRRRLSVRLPRSPAAVLPDIERARGDAVALVTAAHAEAAQVAAFDLRRVDAVVTALATALEPLEALRDQLVAWVRRTGVAVDPANIGPAVATALEAVRARLHGAVGLRLEAQLRESLRAAVTAGIDAALAAIDATRASLAALDPAPLIADLTALHAAKRAEIAALRPSTRLADVVATLATLEHDLRTFDPLADVRPVLTEFRAAADAVASELAPSVILAPAITAFERTAGTLTNADVDTLFGPLLAALHRLMDEVGDGIDDVGSAFGRLQAALP